MKVIKRLVIILLILSILAGGGYLFYQYRKAQQTQTDEEETKNLTTEYVYKDNLEKALNARRKYDFIVVLNPAHGGTDVGAENAFASEKEITLAICEQVIARNTDKKLGIFLTRPQDVGMDETMRLDFIEQLQPDLFVDVHLNKNETMEVGTKVAYCTSYYNRKLSNVEFADIMEKSVVTAVEGIALGIEDVTGTGDCTILHNLTMPSVSIVCGNMLGETEGELLGRENYQKNLAGGILEGIFQAKEKLTEEMVGEN